MDTTPRIPVPLQATERRDGERVVVSMPVLVRGMDATTNNLSAGGLSFQSARPFAVGARVEVIVNYLLDGHSYPWRGEAEVLRVEQGPDGYTIGARLLTQPPADEVVGRSG